MYTGVLFDCNLAPRICTFILQSYRWEIDRACRLFYKYLLVVQPIIISLIKLLFSILEKKKKLPIISRPCISTTELVQYSSSLGYVGGKERGGGWDCSAVQECI